MTDLIKRLEYITDPNASVLTRIQRRSHLTDHDLRQCIAALRTKVENVAGGGGCGIGPTAKVRGRKGGTNAMTNPSTPQTEPTQEAMDLVHSVFVTDRLDETKAAALVIQAALDKRVHSIRTDVFDVLRRHDVSEQCFAEVAAVTQSYLGQVHEAPTSIDPPHKEPKQ